MAIFRMKQEVVKLKLELLFVCGTETNATTLIPHTPLRQLRTARPFKLSCCIRVNKNQRNIKSGGQQNCLVVRELSYIWTLYNEVPLYETKDYISCENSLLNQNIRLSLDQKCIYGWGLSWRNTQFSIQSVSLKSSFQIIMPPEYSFHKCLLAEI